MTFDQIMDEITQGLSGDNAADVAYLNEQSEKYKDHELSTEILRACGRMVSERLSEDQTEAIHKIINNKSESVNATIDEINFCIYKEEYDKAGKLCRDLITNIEKDDWFADDSVSSYFTFYEFFEELLYICNQNPEKDIRHAQIPYSEIYFLYGGLLFEEGKYLEARDILAKAVKWNPVNAHIAFEYIETFKAMGEIDKFGELTLKMFSYVFKRNDLARCYRNLGYYFVEKELYKEAAACCLISLGFDKENKTAQAELYYIHQNAPEGFSDPTVDEAESYSEKYGFPMGFSDDVIGIAYTYGKRFFDKKQYEGSLYCFEIAYEMTEDEDIKNIIDVLKSNEQKAEE